MRQFIPLLSAGLLLAGCTASETIRPSAPLPAVVKSTPPKPVLPAEPAPAPPVKPVPPDAAGAEFIPLPASNGTVTFPHRTHQQQLNGCSSCHAGIPGTIAGLGKEWAHQTCKGCHTAMKAGPTGCSGCHKK